MPRLLVPVLLLALALPALARESATVSGRVVDEKGNPVAGARVHVGQYRPGGMADTDAEGRFEVQVAPDMRAPIRIIANGFRLKDVEAEPGTKGMRIVLDPGVTIRGRLVVPDGAKMPTTVRIVTDHRRSRAMTASVDADGSFVCRGFEAPGRRALVALHAETYDVATQAVPIHGKHGVVGLAPVSLKPARALALRVRDHRGRPVAGAAVHASVHRFGVFGWRGETDAAGRIRFPATANGALEVRVRAADSKHPGRVFRITPSRADTSRDLELLPHVLVSGTLVWTGSTRAPWVRDESVSVLATVHKGGKQVTTWFGRTNGEGASTFVLERADAGSFELRLSIALEQWLRSGPVSITIPRSALDTGRHDIGTIEIAPTKAR